MVLYELLHALIIAKYIYNCIYIIHIICNNLSLPITNKFIIETLP